jgi:hypothetical protein
MSSAKIPTKVTVICIFSLKLWGVKIGFAEQYQKGFMLSRVYSIKYLCFFRSFAREKWPLRGSEKPETPQPPFAKGGKGGFIMNKQDFSFLPTC